MRLPRLRRFLLSLIGPQPDAPLAPQLDAGDWQRVSAMAAQHRIQPFLHARLLREELPVPASIREQWRAAHRASGIRALAQRKALLDGSALLQAAGIRAVALKGAWAAWHAYPAPAERPMRDLDLLVAEDEALAAFALLLEHGYRQEEASPRTPAQSLAHDKHLPPLLACSGVRLELHMRLWERSEAIGWPMPEDETAAMLARAEASGDDPICYLNAEDRLAHCIIHGAYSNRLNGGPLTLLDIAGLVRLGGIDWPRFWQRADRNKGQGSWARGAELLFHLADRYCSPGLLDQAQCPWKLRPEVWENAPELLLQDLDARKAVGMVAGVASQWRESGLSGAAGAALGRLRGQDRGVHVGHDSPGPKESFASWAVRRTAESAQALSSREVRNVARGTTRLGEWLDGKG